MYNRAELQRAASRKVAEKNAAAGGSVLETFRAPTSVPTRIRSKAASVAQPASTVHHEQTPPSSYRRLLQLMNGGDDDARSDASASVAGTSTHHDDTPNDNAVLAIYAEQPSKRDDDHGGLQRALQGHMSNSEEPTLSLSQTQEQVEAEKKIRVKPCSHWIREIDPEKVWEGTMVDSLIT